MITFLSRFWRHPFIYLIFNNLISSKFKHLRVKYVGKLTSDWQNILEPHIWCPPLLLSHIMNNESERSENQKCLIFTPWPLLYDVESSCNESYQLRDYFVCCLRRHCKVFNMTMKETKTLTENKYLCSEPLSTQFR